MNTHHTIYISNEAFRALSPGYSIPKEISPSVCISENEYRRLIEYKLPNETISDTILRLMFIKEKRYQ